MCLCAGCEALHYAVDGAHVRVVAFLVGSGCSVHATVSIKSASDPAPFSHQSHTSFVPQPLQHIYVILAISRTYFFAALTLGKSVLLVL